MNRPALMRMIPNMGYAGSYWKQFSIALQRNHMSQSRRSLLIAGASLAAILTLAACGGGGTAAGSGQGGAVQDGVIPVVASTNVYGDIAKEIGGNHVSVHA